jgi:preprotein translocase subunit SecD
MRRPKTRLPTTTTLALLLLPALAAAGCTAARLLAQRDRGGIYLLVAVKAGPPQLEPNIARASEVIRARCVKLRVRCDLQRRGGGESNRLMIRVAAPEDPARVRAVLLAGGMEVRPVISKPSPWPLKVYATRAEVPLPDAAAGEVLPYDADDGKSYFLVVERAAVITGDDVRNAAPFDLTLPEGPERCDITFNLKPEGAARLSEWTGANIGRYVAVVLDGRVRTAPYIKSKISDTGLISGHFTRRQAADTALVLTSGNLPPLELIEEGAYKPTGDA